MGNKVKAYDIERCICDIIRSKNRMDSEHINIVLENILKERIKTFLNCLHMQKNLVLKKL